MNKRTIIAVIIAAAGLVTAVNADILTISAIQDRYVRETGDDGGAASQTMLMGNFWAPSWGDFIPFMEFSLNDPVLDGATINSVTLRLTSSGYGAGEDINISLYEMAGINTGWVDSTVSFSQLVDGSTDWAGGNAAELFVAGTDYVDTVLGSYSGDRFNGGASASAGIEYDLGNAALAAAVQNTIGGNLDLVILPDETNRGSSQYLSIATIENTSFSGPQLIVDYTVIPEPATMGLVSLFGAVLLGLRRFRV